MVEIPMTSMISYREYLHLGASFTANQVPGSGISRYPCILPAYHVSNLAGR